MKASHGRLIPTMTANGQQKNPLTKRTILVTFLLHTADHTHSSCAETVIAIQRFLQALL